MSGVPDAIIVVEQPEQPPLVIEVVPNQVCPECGGGFPNRPKVELDGVWWWKCYTPTCSVDYWDPDTGRTEP